MPASAARRSSRPDVSSPPKEAARAQLNVAEAARDAAPSPALALQARLEQGLQAQAQEARWPLYTALTFWVGISSLMWAAIIGCVWILLRHI